MKNISQIQVKSDLTYLSQVLSWFDQLNQSEIPKAVWIQCKTAIAEGFTNAVRHAHREKSSETSIDIEVIIQVNRLEIQIWDQGAAFNLEQKLETLSEVVNKNSIGGRGLHLLKQLADHLSYTRTSDGRNCLLIIKNYNT